MKLMSKLAVIAVIGLSACSGSQEDPGGFTGELQPLDVQGHDVRIVTAHSWAKTCKLDGSPTGVATMIGTFEHVPHDRRLTNLGTSVVVGGDDCLEAIGIVADLSGKALVADGLLNGGGDTIANAQQSTSVGVDVDVQ